MGFVEKQMPEFEQKDASDYTLHLNRFSNQQSIILFKISVMSKHNILQRTMRLISVVTTISQSVNEVCTTVLRCWRGNDCLQQL